jgi:hypothetical protein
MFQTKFVDIIKRHILCSIYVYIFFFFCENRVVYEIMWKNIVVRGRPQVTVWHMRIARLIPKATHTHTHTHSQYVILIAVPLQQWLHERPSMSRYTYIARVAVWHFCEHSYGVP